MLSLEQPVANPRGGSSIPALVRIDQASNAGAAQVADRIIENPIINSPYRAPDRHFRFDDEGITSDTVPGRRPSQYFVPVPRPRKRGQQIELDFAEFTADKIRKNDFVNQVRDRVNIWRKQKYPHVTPTTRRLLEHWSDPERENKILFAQREAAETAIYLAEAAQKAGDAWIRNQLNETNTACNLSLHRVALKMATGSQRVTRSTTSGPSATRRSPTASRTAS